MFKPIKPKAQPKPKPKPKTKAKPKPKTKTTPKTNKTTAPKQQKPLSQKQIDKKEISDFKASEAKNLKKFILNNDIDFKKKKAISQNEIKLNKLNQKQANKVAKNQPKINKTVATTELMNRKQRRKYTKNTLAKSSSEQLHEMRRDKMRRNARIATAATLGGAISAGNVGDLEVKNKALNIIDGMSADELSAISDLGVILS